eukprot:CAMPEP_0172302314 /NCGR_PEP_ID=MMETSP1058-20130122/4036_1 /TAXON_ID=83371 /ORGANISM="Detonula confervacea, Strain CCMP 353" /LENGTH=438 /DNA_ID=CAMNT_0013012739 /DNA_START=216 /DNA_END=1532 /DNA_ORIENTATION=+
MGGMMSHDMNNMIMMHHRKLQLEQNNDSNNDNEWDAMPVILDDDETSTGIGDEPNNNKQQHDHNNMHGMDHDSMKHEMNHNHDAHDMENMNMNSGTIMYMDGFRSALFPSSQSSPPPCLNLFHPSWTLHTPSKFVFAMVCVTLIGILVEACGVWRVKCLRKGRNCRREVRLKRLRAWEEHEQLQQSQSDISGQQLEFRRSAQRGIQTGVSDISNVSSEDMATSPAASSKSICPAIIRRIRRTIVPKFIRTKCARIWCCFNSRTNNGMRVARRYDTAAAILHASRALMGYLLMLAVMTYALEFLISAVVGMVLGRYLFVDMEGGGVGGGGGGVMNGAVGVGGGIGGMGLGDGGGRHSSGQGVGMTDLQGNDGTWGGGDPCCGIDDDDDDDNNHDHEAVGNGLRNGSGHDMREPLLSSLMGNNVGVTRRSGGGFQAEENP